jgi:hypothetical protein
MLWGTANVADFVEHGAPAATADMSLRLGAVEHLLNALA